MTPEAAYDACVAAIVALVPDETEHRGKFVHDDGPPVFEGLTDRHFRLDVQSMDEILPDGRMGCEERVLLCTLSVPYVYSDGAQRRALADAHLLINALRGLIGGGITQLDPESSEFDHVSVPGWLIASRHFQLMYSGV